MQSSAISGMAFRDPVNLQKFINERVAEKEESQTNQIEALKK